MITKELDIDYFSKFLIHISCLKSDWFYIIHVSHDPDLSQKLIEQEKY